MTIVSFLLVLDGLQPSCNACTGGAVNGRVCRLLLGGTEVATQAVQAESVCGKCYYASNCIITV